MGSSFFLVLLLLLLLLPASTPRCVPACLAWIHRCHLLSSTATATVCLDLGGRRIEKYACFLRLCPD